jgi:predicted amidohydrolase
MILAAAQTRPKRGDIEANLMDHYNLIDLASKNNVELLVFPEMSLTGYEREQAKELAFTEVDERLQELRQLSVDKQMILIVGAPILKDNNVYIGAFIIEPDYSLSIYIKQFLHAGEEEFFQSSCANNSVIRLKDEKISVAICADIDNPLHAANASKVNTTIYAASIFFTPSGMQGAHTILSNYAHQYRMNVLMANFCGQSWGLDAGAQSAFWDTNGNLIAKIHNNDAGLLIVEATDKSWVGTTIQHQ